MIGRPIASTVIASMLCCLVGQFALAGTSLSLVPRPGPASTQDFLSATTVETAGATTVVPPGQRPRGRTYGQWAVAWWQWALETPAPPNPLAGTTSTNCDGGQRGKVWFLGGTFLSEDPVTRTCRIPNGTSLFFPISNQGYFAFTTDPPWQKTNRYLRRQTCDKAAGDRLSLAIDGRQVPGINQFFAESPIFAVDLPIDNLLGATAGGIPGLVLRPSVDAGYYAFLAPLPVGAHVIRWRADTGCSVQDVTYHLTVEPRPS